MTPASAEIPNSPLIEKISDDVAAALRRAGFADDQSAAILAGIRPALVEAVHTEISDDSGAPKVVAGGVFYGLKDIGGKVIESGVKLALLAIIAGHGQIDAAHAQTELADCLMGLRKTVLKLNDVQKAICVAIMDVSAAKRMKTFVEPGASAQEIRKYFEVRNEIVPVQLEKRLEELVSGTPKVLEPATYGDRGPFYQIRF